MKEMLLVRGALEPEGRFRLSIRGIFQTDQGRVPEAHDLAKAQLGGFGTIVTFDVGSMSAAVALCNATRLIRHATSLGAVESTMERRAAIPGQEHLPAGLIRLSVGIEATADLVADLDRALRR